MPKQKTFMENTIILFIAMMVTKLVGAIFKIPLTNILGGSGMGYFSTAYSLYSPILALTAAGIPTVIVKLVAQNVASCNYANARKIKRVALIIFSALGFIGTLTILIFAKPFAEFVAGSPDSTLALMAIAPAVVFCCISSVYRGYFEGLCNMMPTALSQVVESVVRAVVGLSLSYFVLNYGIGCFENGEAVFGQIVNTYEQAVSVTLPYSAASAILAVTISEFAGALFIYFRSKFMSDGITKWEYLSNPKTERAVNIAKKLIKDSIPISLGAIVINMSSFIDLITITRCVNFGIAANPQYFAVKYADILAGGTDIASLGNFMYGCYTGVVSTVFMLIPAFTCMLGKSALPKIAAAWQMKNKKELEFQIGVVLKFNFMVGFPLYLGITALSEPILNLLYGGKPHEVSLSIIPLAILGLGGIALTLSSTFISFFQIIGRSDLPIKLMLISAAIKLISNVFLISIPEININGVAISNVLSNTVVAIGGFIALEYITKIDFKILSKMFPSLAAGIWCAATSLFSYDLLKNHLSLNMSTVLSIGIGGIFYILLLIIIGGNPLKNLSNKRKNKVL